MKSVNLLFLTRIQDPESMSLLFQALSGSSEYKQISPHEAASLRALTEMIASAYRASGEEESRWVSRLDGFFFFYTIEHIGKEFDLIKLSSDGECALNIELKSEAIEEERIATQLEQNRYYLSHTARTIYSFTFVLSTGALYVMNDRGHLRKCEADVLLHAMNVPAFEHPLEEGISRFFRSADYMISPVDVPEKFLEGQYFLTNQQFDFERRILEHLKEEPLPVIAIAGIGGTGKSLLLYDIAYHLSKKRRILLIHAGLLRRGHFVIDARLKNVDIISSDELRGAPDLTGCSALLIDDAENLDPAQLRNCVEAAQVTEIPLIMACTYNQLPGGPSGTAVRIRAASTLVLEFTGNIRINRPIYSFLRTLLNRKDHPGRPDYSCIDVLFAENPAECDLFSRHFTERGYRLAEGAPVETDQLTVVLTEDFYYDDALRLCVKGGSEEPLRRVSDGILRTREKLCVIVLENQELFRQILKIKLQ